MLKLLWFRSNDKNQSNHNKSVIKIDKNQNTIKIKMKRNKNDKNKSFLLWFIFIMIKMIKIGIFITEFDKNKISKKFPPCKFLYGNWTVVLFFEKLNAILWQQVCSLIPSGYIMLNMPKGSAGSAWFPRTDHLFKMTWFVEKSNKNFLVSSSQLDMTRLMLIHLKNGNFWIIC